MRVPVVVVVVVVSMEETQEYSDALDRSPNLGLPQPSSMI
jgi:hypothetical protein